MSSKFFGAGNLRKDLFVVDNPFRLTGAGSDADFATLKRNAEARFRATQVGLAEALPLTDLLGESSVERPPDYVRAVGNDPELLAAYRIFWSWSNDAFPYLEGKADPNKDEADDLQKHHAFLRCWLQFLQRGEPASLKATFNLWTTLRNSDSFKERLTESSGGGSEVAIAALDRAERHLIDFSVQVATDLWDQGVPLQSLDLVNIAFHSSISAHTKEVSAIPLLEVGDRAEASLTAMSESMPSFGASNFSTNPPKEIYFLERLSAEIRDYAPNSQAWKNACERWFNEVAHRFYQQAQITKGKESIGHIQSALNFVRDPEFRDHLEAIRQKGSRVRESDFKMSSPGADDDRFTELTPIRSTPTLYTLNGIGTKLYRSGTYEKDHSLSYAILFITFLFIPIVPLCRYVVRDEGSGYRFFGKTAWTKWMYGHMTLGAIGLMYLFAMINAGSASAATTADSPSNSSPASVYTNPVYTPPPKGTINTPQQVAENERYDRLSKERDTLINKSNEEYASILTEELDIDTERTSLKNLASKIEAGKSDDFDGYERRRKAFNRKVRAHNDRVDADKKRRKRIDEIEKALR